MENQKQIYAQMEQEYWDDMKPKRNWWKLFWIMYFLIWFLAIGGFIIWKVVNFALKAF